MSDPTTSKPVSEALKFVAQFPQWMQNSVCALMNGQLETEEAFEAYEVAHEGDTLKSGQHPVFAVSSDSHPSGHEKFFVGEALLGQTLALRTPSALCIDDKKEVTPTFQSFLALVHSKHISHLIHVKGSSSELIKLAYDHHKHAGKKTEALPEVLRSFANSRDNLYHQVQEMGLDYYRGRGVNLVGTYEDQTLQAMAVEQAMRDHAKIPENADTPTVVLIFQNEAEGRHYVFNPEVRKFTIVPTQEHKAEKNQEEALVFLDRLPKDEAWQHIGQALMVGATEFAKAKKDEFKQELLLRYAADETCDSSSCSDSRTPAKVILGRSASRQRHILRTPGAFWSDENGNLSYESKLYLALAAERGRIVAHAHHGNCGAMGAVDLYGIGQGDGLPKAFQDMGEFRLGLFKEVRSHGNTEQEIVDHYRKTTGVNVLCAADCLGLQQVIWDHAAASRDPSNPHVVAVYQNMPEGRTYVLNPNAGKFAAVPTNKDLHPEPLEPNKSALYRLCMPVTSTQPTM